MIPKIIHFFWFGNNPKGEKEANCINSWKKYCPDYEIIEWNETNVDLDIIPFVREAYDAKKYAFASDVLRLWAIYTYGGIYFDTDVELIKSYDELLDCKGFIGFENSDFINSGQCIAAEKGNPIIKEMFDFYKTQKFVNDDGSYNMIGCPIVNTNILVNNGLIKNGQYQELENFIVYPSDYFNPYDDATGRLNKTENTYSIHWYAKSWLDEKSIRRSNITRVIHRILGVNSLTWLKKIIRR